MAIFTSWAIKRIRHSNCKNCIRQAVPNDSCTISLTAAKETRKDFLTEDADVVVNADQTFINFYPKSLHVIAPKSSRYTEGNVKANIKLGFTLMVTEELSTSTMQDQFIVFAGIKIEEAITKASKYQTNDYKYST